MFKRSFWLLCGEWLHGPLWKQGHHLVGCCSRVGDDGGCWYPGTGVKGTSSRRCGAYRQRRLSHKKEWKDVVCSNTTWMDLVIIMLSDRSERQTNTMWYHMWNLKKECRWLYILTKQRQTYRKHTYGLGKGTELGQIRSMRLTSISYYSWNR